MGVPMTAPEQWPIGTPVEITAGLSKGLRGLIVAPVDWRFGAVPQWRVKVEGRPLTSVLRQDFLRRLS